MEIKNCDDVEPVKRLLKENFNKTNITAFIKTYGCIGNFSDSEKIKTVVRELGVDVVEDILKADIIFFNTCAVREHAESKVFGHVGELKKLKKTNPSLIIIFCGCMAAESNVQKKIKEAYPFIDIVFGTRLIQKISNLIKEFLMGKRKKIFLQTDSKDFDEAYKDGEIAPTRAGRVTAFVPIMNGCDNFCSYCIVPYVRGREVSRPSSSIIREVKEAISSGYKEIILLGQNVNSYGKNLDEKVEFASLLEQIDNIEGDYFLRFMSSHPKDMSKKIIDVISKGKHICHHIHLPVQSGSNKILKLMNRKYLKEDYYSIIDYAKNKIPDVTFSSDVIVGFPGEVYKDFKETLELIKTVKFSCLFTFVYSKREGTKAASFEDNVTYKEKQKWFKELLGVQQKIEEDYYKSLVGKNQKVLVTEYDQKNNILNGKTANNINLYLNCGKKINKKDCVGKFLNCRVTGFKRTGLIADID